MVRCLFVLVGLLFFWACGSTEGTGTSSSSTSTTSTTSATGWSVLASSGEEVVANPEFSGGATDGQVAGSFGAFMLSEDIGWTVGNLGEVLASSDGFDSATYFSNFPSSSILRSVFGVSQSEFWIVGRDTTNDGASVWVTADGGSTWTVEVNTATSYTGRSITTTDRLNEVLVNSDDRVLVVGGLGDNTALIVGRDTVGDWFELYRDSPSGTDDELNGVAVINDDPDLLVVVGNTGVILTSSDAGVSWTARTSGTEEYLHDVACGGTTCFAVGNTGTVLQSDDAAVTWGTVSVGSTESFATIFIRPTSDKIWIGGSNGTILYSSDGGTSWSAQDSNTTFPIQDIFMISDDVGLAACSNNTSNTGAILKTTTGGE